jgi:hypothetical protein
VFCSRIGCCSRVGGGGGTRWTVECCFVESKSLVGLDEYEV